MAQSGGDSPLEIVGKSSENGFAEALVLIIADLKTALERQPADRASYIAAITSTAYFVKATIGCEAANRLMRLAIALNDLNNGTVNEILRPAHRNNRPPGSSDKWVRRANLALALQCWFRLEGDLQAAAGKVALSANVDRKSLIHWRHELSAERVRNEIAHNVFQNGLRRIDDLDTKELPGAALAYCNLWNCCKVV